MSRDTDTTTDRPSAVESDDQGAAAEPVPVHVTGGLLDVLLEMSVSAEPETSSVVLATTPAGDFEPDLSLDPETPVLTHFFMPDAGGSVSAVFGVDLGTPAGRGRARFVSHPQGPPTLTKRDDLAAVVLVAVPPWERSSVAAYGRSGDRLDLRVVDADPPEETFDLD